MSSQREFSRREVLASAAALSLASALPAGVRADEFGAGEVAGQIAVWAAGQAGSFGAKYALTQAMSALGFDQSNGVNKKLDEINGKLDKVLDQLQVLNSRLDDLSRQITGLMNAIDINFRDLSAQIDQTSLKNDFALIDGYYGSRATASNANLFGLLRLSGDGQVKTQAIENFVANRDDVADALRRVHAQLTYGAGSSDPLIAKWATLLIAKMRAAGPNTSLETYARVLELWFVDAVSRQLRGGTVLLFCDGQDAASQEITRRESGSMIAKQCRLYLNAMERMALTWSRPAPSGPTFSVERVAWMPGAAEWLLRADVFARALTLASEPPNEQDMAVRLSGCYGRVLMRASEVSAQRDDVSLTAFTIEDPDARRPVGPLLDWKEVSASISGRRARFAD